LIRYSIINLGNIGLPQDQEIDESLLKPLDEKFFKRCSYILYCMYA
jgi:hypothetical protein